MAGEHAPSLLELDLGFLALPRRLWSSDWFRSLGPAEKLVVVDTLMIARHSPGGEFWFAGKRIPLAIGQFIDSEEERARRCGVSRKVIRTTDRKMTAAGLIRRQRAHPAGRCPFITTVLDYERISLRSDGPGPRTEQPPGQCGASNGPAEGQQGAPSEQGNLGEPGEPGNPASLRDAGAPSARARRGGHAPAGFQRVVQHWFAAWERAGRGKHASLTQAEGAMVKDLVRQLGEADLVERIDRAFGDPWFLERGDLGLFRKQVQRFAPSGSTAPARPARRLGDLGVEHGGEWWLRLPSAELERFAAERKALDPELDGAPFPALGVAAPRQVEELIARYRGGEFEQPGAAAGGAR